MGHSADVRNTAFSLSLSPPISLSRSHSTLFGNLCSWNGPSWPYETARVLTGLSNLINNYPGQQAAGRPQYMQVLRQYAVAHTQSATPNASSPYIGENIEYAC